MLRSELPEAVQAHHFTIVMYQLGDHAHRGEPRKPAEINRRFRVPGRSRTPPLTPGAEKYARPCDRGRRAAGISQNPGCQGRSVAEIPVLTPTAASQDTV
ncbi:hypothetical protein AHiyo8_10310 [Arthrobacter sp. Hiyo8]|nr:hypothetical protein AHiyo8_10310 [Arthrobacter sp. Hiyo8]